MSYDDPLRVDLRYLPDGGIRLTIDVPHDSILTRVAVSKDSAFLSWPTEVRLRGLVHDLERDRDKRMPADPRSWTGLAERAAYNHGFEQQHEAQKIALRRNWALIAGRFDADLADAPGALGSDDFDLWMQSLQLGPYHAEAVVVAMTALMDQAARDGIKVAALDNHIARVAAQDAASKKTSELNHV